MQDTSRAVGTTIDAVFQRSFRVFAERVAVTSEDGSWTYREIGARSHALACALKARGIERGSRVAVLSETRPEYVETYAALASLGATALTLNIRLHADEVKYCVASGRATAVIVSGGLTQLLDSLRQDSRIAHWICLDAPPAGYEGYAALLAEGADQAGAALDDAPRPADIYNVLYTSGTTGRPKGAMISQQAAAVRGMRLAQWFRLTPEDGFIGWLPLFHCGGDEPLYASILSGGTYCTLKKADADVMMRVTERDRLTWTLLLPGVLTDFLNNPRRGDYDLSSFRLAIGYANMMPEVIRDLTTTFNIEFSDAFGQTEASLLLAHGRSGPGELPNLRKTPTPLMEVRIVDDDMNEQPVGIPGECVVRGPSVMSGYLENEAATAAAFKGDWLHTGDLLARNGDGTLCFVDRKKYLIKTGGENVYPAEVESIIAQLPGVQETAVFGVPHPHWGEAVKAVIVLRPGAELDGVQVVAFCREHLASYKRPRYVEFMASDQIPRSTTGKLQRHLLAERPTGEAIE